MPDPSKKYPNYKALAEAFRTGELDPKKYVLKWDDGNCYLAPQDGDACDAEFEECDNWFRGDGDCEVEEVIRALGIPCEGV